MNRSSCGRRPKYIDIVKFLNWADNKMLKDKWSPDACVGYAKEIDSFQHQKYHQRKACTTG